MIPAAGIAIVAFNDNVLTARTFAVRHGQDIDANAELRALGVCNVGAGLMQGFPVSSSGSRTALGDAVGGRTQLYSLVTLVFVLVVMLFGRGVLATFPSAALGALVVYAAVRLIDVSEFKRLARFRRSEVLLALATTVAVLVLGVLYGVLVAIGLSILELLRRMARAHDGVLGFVPGVAGMHDVDDYPEADLVPGLLVYRYDAPLFFANAENFRERAIAAVNDYPGRVEWFVLNAEANVEVDLTALDALDQLRTELERRGIVFAMARVKQDLRDASRPQGWSTRSARIASSRLCPLRSRHTGEPRNDLVAETLHEADGVGVARQRADIDQVDAQTGVALRFPQVPVEVSERIDEQTGGQPDVRWVASDGVAMTFQYGNLVCEFLGARRGAVPHVCVLGDKAQRLLLAVTTDKDRWPPNRLWLAYGLGQLIVLAGVGPVVVAPHLLADLQCLLEHLEPFTQGRVWDAEGDVLAVVPGGADPEHRSATRQHVESGDGLRQHTGIAIGDASDQERQVDRLSLGGQET